jgi:DedD protein
LLGAIVLVVLAVAILPFVLDNEPQQVSETISIQIPPKDSAPPAASPAPEQAPPAQPVSPETALPETKAPPQEPAAALAETPKPENQKEPAKKPAAEKGQRAIEKTAPQGSEFVVQLGAFSDPKNAKQAQDKLKKAGIKSYTEQSADSKTIRVRAGPYSSREQAENIRDKLKAMGYDGLVAAR